jgi:hypothetical protein
LSREKTTRLSRIGNGFLPSALTVAGCCACSGGDSICLNEVGEEGEEGLHGELHFEMFSVGNGLDDM